MANYSPNDILTMVQPFVKGIPVSTIQYIAFDMAHSTIWRAYPWSWTQGALTAIALVDGTQDYAIADNDFFRLITARITRTDVTPNRYQELSVVEYIPPELSIKTQWGNFRLICRVPETSKLRLETAPGVPFAMQIDGSYQKQPTKIVAANWATALASPDWYVEPFVEGFLYYLYKFSDDGRAGGIQTDGEDVQYTGQLATFYNALHRMAMQEDANNGQSFIFPTDPIGFSLMGRVVSVYGN